MTPPLACRQHSWRVSSITGSLPVFAHCESRLRMRGDCWISSQAGVSIKACEMLAFMQRAPQTGGLTRARSPRTPDRHHPE
jgi:hypothetical protein